MSGSSEGIVAVCRDKKKKYVLRMRQIRQLLDTWDLDRRPDRSGLTDLGVFLTVKTLPPYRAHLAVMHVPCISLSDWLS